MAPKPNVIVRPLAGRPIASPVSSGGSVTEPPTAPVEPTSSPRVICSAAAVQVRSSATSSARDSVTTSRATKCNRSWAGRGDAGLVLAAERVRRRAVEVGRRRLGGPPGEEAAAAQAGDGRAAAEQAATTDPGQDSTAAVSRPNGSARALTASERSLTSARSSSS